MESNNTPPYMLPDALDEGWNFARALLAERLSAKLSQEDLGSLLEVDGSTVGGWERGHFKPSAECLKRIYEWQPALQAFEVQPTVKNKPSGFTGPHEGVTPGMQPTVKQTPNRVRGKTRDKVVRAPEPVVELQRILEGQDARPVARNFPIVELPQLPKPTQMPLEFKKPEQPNDLLRILQKYNAFLALMPPGSRLALLNFLHEAFVSGLSLQNTIDILKAMPQ
jgi:transcriptional regulator with XRE-family HTH domain